MFEKYNLNNYTFFASVGEIDFTLHKILKVSVLFMGDLPYEEYILSTKGLHLLTEDDPQVHETYSEVLCHFHICVQMTWLRSG